MDSDSEEEDSSLLLSCAAKVAAGVAMANTVFAIVAVIKQQEIVKPKSIIVCCFLERRFSVHEKRLLWLSFTAARYSFLVKGAAFVMMFRISSKARVELLMCDIMAADIPFFILKKDCIGRDVPSLEARILLPLKTLAYGVDPHAFTDYFQISETMARKCCYEFDSAVLKNYQKEYLRLHIKEDIKSV